MNKEKFTIRLEWTVQDVLDELDTLRGEYNTSILFSIDDCITTLRRLKDQYDKVYGLKCVDISYVIRDIVHERGDFETFDQAVKHLLKKADEDMKQYSKSDS